MSGLEEILQLIPHRPPFLWVDRIVRRELGAIETEKLIPVDLELFKGHYPDYPIVPGVLLCEAVFQSGALLMADAMEGQDQTETKKPVLTRIGGARFKREVRPGDLLQIKVTLKEKVGPAWFMTGRLSVGGKTAITVDFACALV